MLNMAEGLARIGALAASPVVATLADAFAAAGHELAIVGWPVRDALLGRRTNDLDFTTDARPDEILRIVEPIATATWDIGRAFGTIGAKIRGEQVEITTYRADSYDGVTRKPTVEFGDTLEGDLARRDFTVNAMALRVPGPALVDPTGGVEDLVAGVLRTPSDPAVSFGDDPLRMLRAARFASQLGFDPARQRPNRRPTGSTTCSHCRTRASRCSSATQTSPPSSRRAPEPCSRRRPSARTSTQRTSRRLSKRPRRPTRPTSTTPRPAPSPTTKRCSRSARPATACTGPQAAAPAARRSPASDAPTTPP